MKNRQLYMRLGPDVLKTLLKHFATIEESVLRCGLLEAYYTGGFSMFGMEGEDHCSRFGRMCRTFGVNHLSAPTPQAKGKVERSMRTFQHRIVVVLKALALTTRFAHTLSPARTSTSGAGRT